MRHPLRSPCRPCSSSPGGRRSRGTTRCWPGTARPGTECSRQRRRRAKRTGRRCTARRSRSRSRRVSRSWWRSDRTSTTCCLCWSTALRRTGWPRATGSHWRSSTRLGTGTRPGRFVTAWLGRCCTGQASAQRQRSPQGYKKRDHWQLLRLTGPAVR